MTAPTTLAPLPDTLSAATTPAAEYNRPDWRDPKLQRFKQQRTRCVDVLGGTDAVRAKATDYLKQLPRETPRNYLIRVELSEVTNLFAGAVRSAEGLMLAEPPKVDTEASPEFRSWWQDVDGMQTGGEQWLRGLLREHLLTRGWGVVVIGTPVKAGALPTLADVQANRLRPYLSIYNADDVLSVRFARIGGRRVLSQIVFAERIDEAFGNFGMRSVPQVRVLTRGRPGAHVSQVYRQDNRGEWLRYGAPDMIQTSELPVVEFSALPAAGFGQAPPPLVELADLTLAHYRISSDRRWSLKQACFPWLVRVGYLAPDGETVASVNEALDLPIGGDAKWISPDGTAFQPTRDELSDIERRAAMLSLSFLAGESANPGKTATAAKIDQQGQDASLAAVAISIRDGLNRVGAIVAEMLGEEVRDRYFDVRTSFRGVQRDPQFLQIVVDAWKAGGLPLVAMLEALEHGKLPDSFDAEQAALEAVAEADAQRQIALDMARQTGSGSPGGTNGSPDPSAGQVGDRSGTP